MGRVQVQKASNQVSKRDITILGYTAWEKGSVYQSYNTSMEINDRVSINDWIDISRLGWIESSSYVA